MDSTLFIDAYRWMLLARLLDEKFAAMYRAGKIHGSVFVGRGQEALSVSIGIALRKGDVFAPLIRDAAGRLAFGEPVLDAVRTYLGSARGPMRGREGNVHRGHPREGLLAMISHLGSSISVVNGALWAKRFKGVHDAVGVASIGDGCTSTGACHEAINQAAVERLPVVLVIANNQYAYSTPTRLQFACRNLVDRAVGYGVQGHTVDGTDLGACLDVVGTAIRHAREGAGPQMVVANLLRLSGHGEHDDASYMDPALKSSPLGRDCLHGAAQRIQESGWADGATIEAWRSAAQRLVDDAINKAQKEPTPDPFSETWSALATPQFEEGLAVS